MSLTLLLMAGTFSQSVDEGPVWSCLICLGVFMNDVSTGVYAVILQ